MSDQERTDPHLRGALKYLRDWREKSWRRRSQWERSKFRLFYCYLGDDSDEPPRVRLICRRLTRRRDLAFMPARHIHAPVFGLSRRGKPTPRYQTWRTLRAQRAQWTAALAGGYA